MLWHNERSRKVLAGGFEGGSWSWELALYPLDDRRTRLVSRSGASARKTIGVRLFMWCLAPVAWIVIRKMLLGINRRAKASADAAAVA